jgi:hypothetical protein
MKSSMVSMRLFVVVVCSAVVLVPPITRATLAAAVPVQASRAPDCTGVERWPASIAFTQLKNAGVTDNDRLDFSKTTVRRLASEPMSRRLFRQVHLVAFTEKSGKRIEVITVNDASQQNVRRAVSMSTSLHSISDPSEAARSDAATGVSHAR